MFNENTLSSETCKVQIAFIYLLEIGLHGFDNFSFVIPSKVPINNSFSLLNSNF